MAEPDSNFKFEISADGVDYTDITKHVTHIKTASMSRSLMGIKIIETPYLTKTEEYTESKRVKGRGILRKVKAYRQVASDEILILDAALDGRIFAMHPETAAKVRGEMAARLTNLADMAFLVGNESAIDAKAQPKWREK